VCTAGPKILLYTFLSKMFNCFLSLFINVQVSDAYVNVMSIIVFFSLNFSFFDMFLFLKNFYFLAFFILSCKSIWLSAVPTASQNCVMNSIKWSQIIKDEAANMQEETLQIKILLLHKMEVCI